MFPICSSSSTSMYHFLRSSQAEASPQKQQQLIATCLFLLLLTNNLIGSTRAAIKVRRQFDENSSPNHYSSRSVVAPPSLSPAKQLLEAFRLKQQRLMGQQTQQQQQKVDAHCWIKVERKPGEVYEENGSCSMLSRGVYACQSKTFLDPFNPYCMFMD